MVPGWDEDDDYAALWWVAEGWGELLVERVSDQRGPREWAGRDLATLLLYRAALTGGGVPGLTPLGDLRRELAHGPRLRHQLASAMTDEWWHRTALRCLENVDIDTGAALLVQLVDQALTNHDPDVPVEDLWPAGTLLSRGGGGTWDRTGEEAR